jgi:hypothetical protein
MKEWSEGAHSELLEKFPQGVSRTRVGPCFVQALRESKE